MVLQGSAIVDLRNQLRASQGLVDNFGVTLVFTDKVIPIQDRQLFTGYPHPVCNLWTTCG